MVGSPEPQHATNNGLHVAYPAGRRRAGGRRVADPVIQQYRQPVGRTAARGVRRVLTFDKRGTGLSDPVPASKLTSIEEWIDDLRAVVDDGGIERAFLIAERNQ
jgi:pimeloyl-ACP methyl ester carboxylesterase